MCERQSGFTDYKHDPNIIIIARSIEGRMWRMTLSSLIISFIHMYTKKTISFINLCHTWATLSIIQSLLNFNHLPTTLCMTLMITFYYIHWHITYTITYLYTTLVYNSYNLLQSHWCITLTIFTITVILSFIFILY